MIFENITQLVCVNESNSNLYSDTLLPHGRVLLEKNGPGCVRPASHLTLHVHAIYLRPKSVNFPMTMA